MNNGLRVVVPVTDSFEILISDTNFAYRRSRIAEKRNISPAPLNPPSSTPISIDTFSDGRPPHQTTLGGLHDKFSDRLDAQLVRPRGLGDRQGRKLHVLHQRGDLGAGERAQSHSRMRDAPPRELTTYGGHNERRA